MALPEDQLIKYKTVLCRRWSASGACSYKELCDYAHGNEELRRNLSKHYYRAIRCKNQERCPFGDECHYAHNEMEMLFHPDLYKTKECNYYNSSSADSCSKGDLCSFAHGKDELRSSGVWSRKHKKGDYEFSPSGSASQGNRSEYSRDYDNDSKPRRSFKRSEDPEGHSAPIRILQHKPMSSSSSMSPEPSNGRLGSSGAASPILSASSATAFQKLEADEAFGQMLSNRKVHLLNVVDQIVQATVQKTMDEAKKSGKGGSGVSGTNGNGYVTINVDVESATLEELTKIEKSLQKHLDQVQQAKKKYTQA